MPLASDKLAKKNLGDPVICPKNLIKTCESLSLASYTVHVAALFHLKYSCRTGCYQFPGFHFSSPHHQILTVTAVVRWLGVKLRGKPKKKKKKKQS